MVFQDSTNLNNISKYIVDKNGDTPYQTIQSALDAANAAGGAIVYVRSGTYTENLTCYDKTELVGAVGQVGSGNVIINGTHIPPTSGTFAITKIQLSSATDIFNSIAAGISLISINECVMTVTNGYTLNLPNWTGQFRFDNCGAFGTDDGFVNNTAGATIFTNNSQLGAGTANTYTANGTIRHDLTFIVCPTNLTGIGSNIGLLAVFGGPLALGGSANWTFDNSSKFFDTITTSGSVAIDIYNSTITTGSNIAITHNSSNPITFSDVSLDSTASSVITGTGTIEIGSITYKDNTTRFGTITADRSTVLETGQIWATNIEDMKFTGFRSWGGSGTYYTIAGTNFTLDRPGDGYIQGKLVSWAGGQILSLIPWVQQTAYIYIGPGGNIAATVTRSVALFQDNIVLFEVLGDAAGTPNFLTVKENHPYDFPTAPSEWAHNTIGSVIDNANNGANIALNGTKGIQINGQDTLLDHGLDTTIPDSAATAVPFNFMYTNGVGKWVKDSLIYVLTFPSLYNNAGTITALGTNKFGIFRLYVSKDDLNSSAPTYYAVIDDQEYLNLAQAQAAIALNTPASATNEFFELELAQLGFVVKQESTDTIAAVIIQKSTVRGATTFATPTAASLINTDTSAFDSWLSGADTTVQAALNTLDDVGKGVSIDPGVAGDSYVQFDINTTNEFRVGVDDDDADKFKISQGGALGTNDTVIITSAGEITKPLQPCFCAYLTTDQLNETGDGTAYQIINDGEIYDQNSDYNNATGVFTAPVTGKYQLTFAVRVSGLTASHTAGVIRLVTSNRTYVPIKLNYATGRTNGNDLTESHSILADMDVGDTAYVEVEILNGTKVVDIEGSAAATAFGTHFSGFLAC